MPMRDQENAALALLGRGRGSEPAYLDSHHLEAARRVQTLFERSRLRPRTTVHYGPRVGSGGGHANDIGDMAVDARRQLAGLYRALPPDCADLVIDICGFEKGLQEVETERGWPRRSAKLVLRIALEAAARHFGLTPIATGVATTRSRSWLAEGARPNEFG
ncbi:DUF6456 domain-containing protein [Pelagibacterium sp. 26DY04]|uniref:DUF6456 domain-containing protein n=1 Tax=Pelagibacterium sp. 26DY04 TaxID=2967130 RepID=UPI00281513EB|nr:DUF6456 domain-containing protein [Pelagibacterium sp. 26DY04]WMT87987.1 DUF6456 domain-containing protein [Pelagibacterium sp. 26DY04]